ncbi:MAG: hypothetical protein ABIV50_12235 [Opitutus sp.]
MHRLRVRCHANPRRLLPAAISAIVVLILFGTVVGNRAVVALDPASQAFDASAQPGVIVLQSFLWAFPVLHAAPTP